jgi:hypothetical protein
MISNSEKSAQPVEKIFSTSTIISITIIIDSMITKQVACIRNQHILEATIYGHDRWM